MLCELNGESQVQFNAEKRLRCLFVRSWYEEEVNSDGLYLIASSFLKGRASLTWLSR